MQTSSESSQGSKVRVYEMTSMSKTVRQKENCEGLGKRRVQGSKKRVITQLWGGAARMLAQAHLSPSPRGRPSHITGEWPGDELSMSPRGSKTNVEQLEPAVVVHMHLLP